MVVTPDSRIILLKSPLKLDNNNQITFTGVEAQFTYFYNLPKLEHGSFSYIRKDGVIRIPTHKADGDGLPTYEDLLEYNYCMYQNTHYDMKWFYAFITDITYQNDGMSEIKIETDAFQTWQFDLIYKDSFIEREHVASDGIGEHTLPEGLENGPYICNYYEEKSDWRLETSKIVVGTTWLPTNTSGWNVGPQIYGGVFSGLYYVAFDYTGTSAKNFIDALAGMGRGDAIVTVFMCPNDLIVNTTPLSGTIRSKKNNYDGTTTDYDYPISGYFIGNNYGGSILFSNYQLAINSTLNGYTPKNNKLFCYPYNYLLATNNTGSNAEFHYEDFINNLPTFNCVGTISPGCSVKMYPSNYKKIADVTGTHPGFNDGIMSTKFPVCSWQNDSFTNWMTQQSVNVMMTQAQTLFQGIGAIATGGVFGEGLFGQQANYLSERYKHALMPPQSQGSINGADIGWANGDGNFGFYKMSIKYEYAKMIDDFFSEFGYQVNRLATPNIHKRSNWDYMKTTSANIEGNVPEKDLDVIRNLLNNGCTFWHTTDYYLDYSRTNSIL